MATMKDALEDTTARHVVSFSGGKDSTALAIYLLDRYPQLNLEIVFCDTGAELPETYEYIARFEAIFGKPVKRLSALKMLGIKERAGRTAFDVIMKEYYGGFLPSPQARWCTRMLKIKPFEAEIGGDRAYSYIGIRADENRDGYRKSKSVVLSNKPQIQPVYPFKENGIGLDEVKAILHDSGLGLPSYYEWRSRSGCYFCFYQQIGEWQGLKERHPDLYEKAKAYEKVENGKKYTWTDRHSLTDIEQIKQRHNIPDTDGPDGCAICHL